MATKKKPGNTPLGRVQGWLDEYGDTIIEKIVKSDAPGSAAAQARVLETLVSHTVAKPTQRLDVTGFSGFKIVDVE